MHVWQIEWAAYTKPAQEHYMQINTELSWFLQQFRGINDGPRDCEVNMKIRSIDGDMYITY